jgi:CheY-like chemotaxis protein
MSVLQRGTVTTILVVDDEPTIRKIVTSTLADLGFDEMYTAGDAESALSVIHDKRPDVVISDVKLPGMSGVELARQVKENDGNTPVLLMSAFGEPRGHKADAFISKPFELDDLTELVRRFI